MMNPYLQVAVGGAIGSVARLGIYRAIPAQGLPWATFAVNVAGSLVMGLLSALLAQRGQLFVRELGPAQPPLPVAALHLLDGGEILLLELANRQP